MPIKKKKKNDKVFCLSTDDFGFLLPGLDDLLRLKEIYPNFKVTCFTMVFPEAYLLPENRKLLKPDKMRKWAEIINKYDWIEIALHGFYHDKIEANSSYGRCELMLKACEKQLDLMGLKYKKIFKAPFWQYSYDALNCLKDKGYIIALDRNHPRTVPEGAITYFYNWSVEEPLPEGKKLVKGHSHTLSRGVTNDLASAYPNIINQIPRNAEFRFVSEVVAEEEQGLWQEEKPKLQLPGTNPKLHKQLKEK